MSILTPQSTLLNSAIEIEIHLGNFTCKDFLNKFYSLLSAVNTTTIRTEASAFIVQRGLFKQVNTPHGFTFVFQ